MEGSEVFWPGSCQASFESGESLLQVSVMADWLHGMELTAECQDLEL